MNYRIKDPKQVALHAQGASGAGFIDGVWYGPGPTAWQCQCGKPYTVTCISSKPPKREWVGLTEEEINNSYLFWVVDQQDVLGFGKSLETKLKRKNT